MSQWDEKQISGLSQIAEKNTASLILRRFQFMVFSKDEKLLSGHTDQRHAERMAELVGGRMVMNDVSQAMVRNLKLKAIRAIRSESPTKSKNTGTGVCVICSGPARSMKANSCDKCAHEAKKKYHREYAARQRAANRLAGLSSHGEEYKVGPTSRSWRPGLDTRPNDFNSTEPIK